MWVVPAVNECLASGLQVGDFTGACINGADFTVSSSTAVVFSMSAWVGWVRSVRNTDI